MMTNQTDDTIRAFGKEIQELSDRIAQWEDGYKVLYRDKDGKLYSCSIPTSYKLEYTVGKTTYPRPRCGPLAVFKELAQACWFIEWHNMHAFWVIHACKFVRSAEIEPFLYVDVTDGNWLRRPLNTCPEGTTLASRVKLLDKVMEFKRIFTINEVGEELEKRGHEVEHFATAIYLGDTKYQVVGSKNGKKRFSIVCGQFGTHYQGTAPNRLISVEVWDFREPEPRNYVEWDELMEMFDK